MKGVSVAVPLLLGLLSCAPPPGQEGVTEAELSVYRRFADLNREALTTRLGEEPGARSGLVSLYFFRLDGAIVADVTCPNPECGMVQTVGTFPRPAGAAAPGDHVHPHDRPWDPGQTLPADVTLAADPPYRSYCLNCDADLGAYEALSAAAGAHPMLMLLVGGEESSAESPLSSGASSLPPFYLRARYLRFVYMRRLSAPAATDNAFHLSLVEVWSGQQDFQYALRDDLRPLRGAVETPVYPFFRPLMPRS